MLESSRLQPLVRVWQDALTVDSFLELQRFIDVLLQAYRGESYWCDSDATPSQWQDCFAVFALVVGATDCAGVEWWVRRVPGTEPKAFHFDKDEELARKGPVVSPLVATVFYVTEPGGPTVIADQIATPNGEPLPARPAELVAVDCRANRFLAFPGNLRHCVLGGSTNAIRTTLLMNWWTSKPSGIERMPMDMEAPSIRLAAPNRVGARKLSVDAFFH